MGVIIMKKAIRLFCILSLITLAVGCSSFDEGDAKKVAEKFVRGIYTVDAEKVAKFSIPIPAPTGDPLSEEYANEYGDAVLKNMKLVDKNVLPLMTSEGYQSIITNQFNSVSTGICAKGNYTAQITDLTLGENVYKDYKDEGKIRYRYEVKMKFISSDGKGEQADASAGAVELLKENGQWKVCLYDINQFPKLYK